MPKVVVYVPTAAWQKMEERGVDPAETVRGLARIGCNVILGFEEKIDWDDFRSRFPPSGAAVGELADSGSAVEHSEEQEGVIASSTPVRPERAAPDTKPKKRLHPCRHHVPPSRVCQYCDV